VSAQEYFTAGSPGFLWWGRVPLFSALDSYIEGRGHLKVQLLNLITIVDEEGEDIDQAELLRWLGEAPWFPTALLPSERLSWEPLDDNSARVTFTPHSLTVGGVFYFNNRGQITSFRGRRYRGGKLEHWSGYYRDYREAGGMLIPFKVGVAWNLESGDLSYARFNLKKIDYNVPKRLEQTTQIPR